MVNKIGFISRVLPFATSEVRTSCKRQDEWNKAYCFTTWYVIFLHNCFFSEYTRHIMYCISCSTRCIAQSTGPVQREVFPYFRLIIWRREHRGQECQSSSIFAGCSLLDAARPWKVVWGQSRSNLARCPAILSWCQAIKGSGEGRNPGQGEFRLGHALYLMLSGRG